VLGNDASKAAGRVGKAGGKSDSARAKSKGAP
jgi:hypothetical protein